MSRSLDVRQSSSLSDLAEAFLLSKRVAGCSPKTLKVYAHWTRLFVRDCPLPVEPQGVQAFFTRLYERNLSASTRHQAYRTLKTFFLWGAAVDKLPEGLLRGIQVRVPRTLPQVPSDDELRSLLSACSQTPEGKRNRAMILVMADAGLRASEVLRLLVEDWRPSERGLFIRAGKGSKDRVSFVSPVTARAIRDYLATRPMKTAEDFLFPSANGKPLVARSLTQILHRLSDRAGIPRHRRIHPHALRHFAATSWLRNSVGLDEVRRLLGHETLHTTLRYSSLVSADLQRAHKRAGAMERIRIV